MKKYMTFPNFLIAISVFMLFLGATGLYKKFLPAEAPVEHPKYYITPGGVVVPLTRLTESDTKRPCEDCHKR